MGLFIISIRIVLINNGFFLMISDLFIIHLFSLYYLFIKVVFPIYLLCIIHFYDFSFVINAYLHLGLYFSMFILVFILTLKGL